MNDIQTKYENIILNNFANKTYLLIESYSSVAKLEKYILLSVPTCRFRYVDLNVLNV